LLAAFVPAFAMAQTAIDSAKQSAINDLLNTINASKLADDLANTAQIQAKQMVPVILSRELTADKRLSNAQKQAAVPSLQKNAMPRLLKSAGQVFATGQFRQAAIRAQAVAYANHYSTDDIRNLTTFYRSPTGQTFLRVQDKVIRDVMDSVSQQYMGQALTDIKNQADHEIATVRRR
jgi:hypothetical protein